MKNWGWAAVGAAGGLVIGVGGTLAAVAIVGVATTAVTAAQGDDRLTVAHTRCMTAEGLDLEDDGNTLVLDTRGDEDFGGASADTYDCVLTHLDAPSSVRSHMQQTTSMDGRQTETWDGIEVSWSYHPDRGLDAIFTLD